MERGGRLALPRPDDWHQHLRDGPALAVTAPASAIYGRFVAMPNLQPPLTDVDAALAYRQRILDALPAGSGAEPLVPLYLTDDTPAQQLHRAARTPGILGAKLYPAGATTNSAAGVASLEGLLPQLQAMEEAGLPLLLHAETTGPDDDIFDREALFIERHLAGWAERFPALKITVEHLSTKVAVDFVRQAREGVAATITPHHLLINRNHLLSGGLRPHNYCLPVAKREGDRRALLDAAIEGGRFFLGSDSAPHARGEKESSCGCAGVYHAPWAVQLCALAFAERGRLDALGEFVSVRGARHYGMELNQGQVELVPIGEGEANADQAIPDSIPWPQGELVPFFAGCSPGYRLRALPHEGAGAGAERPGQAPAATADARGDPGAAASAR